MTKHRKKRETAAVDRRDFLQLSLATGAAIIGLKDLASPTLAMASTTDKRKPFLLYIHAGAFDGLASGLILPRGMSDWPLGAFRKNEKSGSINPNLNRHYKDGSLIMHDYNHFLSTEGITQHMCFANGTPRNLSHIDAKFLAMTGGKPGSTNASWLAGFAQTLAAGTSDFSMLVSEDDDAIKGNSLTNRIASVRSISIDDYLKAFKDPAGIPAGANIDAGKRFWQVLDQMHRRRLLNALIPEGLANQSQSNLNSFVDGLPAFDNAALRTAVTNAISSVAVDAMVNPLPDADGIKAARNAGDSTFFRSKDRLLEQLRLAAMLAASGSAQGMMIGRFGGGDTHAGGSSVGTAREGALLWAHLAVFWKWVVASGLKDQVMVIVSHEFTRTPYNNSPGPESSVGYFDASSGSKQNITFRSPGTDHHLGMGMVFINGKVPPASRIGGFADQFVPFGSRGLDGTLDLEVPAYTSTQIVGSMLIRCFSELFADERVIRQYWKDFTDPIDSIVR